jgi:hypothetical protein
MYCDGDAIDVNAVKRAQCSRNAGTVISQLERYLVSYSRLPLAWPCAHTKTTHAHTPLSQTTPVMLRDPCIVATLSSYTARDVHRARVQVNA